MAQLILSLKKKIEIILNKNNGVFIFVLCLLLLAINVTLLYVAVAGNKSVVRYKTITLSAPNDPNYNLQYSLLEISDSWWAETCINCENCHKSYRWSTINPQKAAYVAHIAIFDGSPRQRRYMHFQPYLLHYNEEYDVFIVLAESRHFFERADSRVTRAVVCVKSGGVIHVDEMMDSSLSVFN